MLSRDIGHGNSKQFDICEWFKKLQYFKDYSPRLQWLLIFGFLDGWSSSNLNLLPMQMLSSSLTTTFSFFCASELSTDTRFFLAGLSCSNLTFALKERLSSSSKSKPQSKPNKKKNQTIRPVQISIYMVKERTMRDRIYPAIINTIQ